MKKIYSLVILFFLATAPLATQAAYNFEQNSGLATSSQTSGYSQQRLFGQGNTIESGISMVLTAALSLLGVIFLIFLIYGGMMWMTARGNDQRLSKAKSIITDSITGVVLVGAAYAISYFILKIFF